MTPTEPLLLVAIARSKKQKKLHQELESLAAAYIAGKDVKEQMQTVLEVLALCMRSMPAILTNILICTNNETTNEDYKTIPGTAQILKNLVDRSHNP